MSMNFIFLEFSVICLAAKIWYVVQFGGYESYWQLHKVGVEYATGLFIAVFNTIPVIGSRAFLLCGYDIIPFFHSSGSHPIIMLILFKQLALS